MLICIYLISVFIIWSESFIIKTIKYLTPETLSEDVMRSYLGFKEGDVLTEKQLAFKIEKAKLRFKHYGIFNSIEILVNDSNSGENGKAVFISLYEGFNNAINAGLWWGNVGWKNIGNRGDYLGFFAGININEFKSIHHIYKGLIFFEQKTGYSFDMDNPFFPFFPLYGNEKYYKPNLYSIIKFALKINSDVRIGLFTGINNYFTLSIVNRENIDSTSYGFNYDYSVIPLGGYFEINQKYLADKWYAGWELTADVSANFDFTNKSVYPSINTNFTGGIFPHSHISIINNIITHNTILSYYPVNIRKSVRGELSLSEGEGNFIFISKLDFRVKLFEAAGTVPVSQYGLTGFYEGVLSGNDYNMEGMGYYSIAGGGFYIRLGTPVNLTIFAELGYTVGKDFKDGYKINIGLGEFF